MSMSAEATKWHEVYEGLTQFEKRRVDNAYTAARTALREDSNFIPDNGDRAEILVAAITKYYKESV